MTIEEILQLEEGQTFDRKSINIDPTDLASTICAFANADGGDIAVGITNRKRLIEGVDFEMNKLNDILRAPLDYCSPTVEIETEYVPCVDMNGQKNHVLVMHIPASPEVHANNADEVRLRVGDKSKKLSFEDRTQLEEIEVNQILGRLEIKNIIGCEDNHAGKIIKIMKELKIIVPVEGKGKGKYVLNVQSL